MVNEQTYKTKNEIFNKIGSALAECNTGHVRSAVYRLHKAFLTQNENLNWEAVAGRFLVGLAGGPEREIGLSPDRLGELLDGLVALGELLRRTPMRQRKQLYKQFVDNLNLFIALATAAQNEEVEE